MLLRFISYLGLISLFILSYISAQEIGQIFSADEANEKFGIVIESISVQTTTVKEWINSTNDKIMFKVKGKSFTVLGDSRELVYSTSDYFESNEEFHMYSKSKLLELIGKGSNSITYLENRKDVFSITNGMFTLEFASICPPYCP
jgi:hypothetical protein